MAKKRKRVTRIVTKGTPEETLDALNARVIGRSNSSDLIRRAVEAQLEAKTKKRRKREAPASSNWKRV